MAKNKPVWDVRLGSIRAAIWRQENKNGGPRSLPWFNVELTRRFKQGEEWKDSSSFSGLAELAQVKQVLELAIEWLSRREFEREVNNDAD